MLLVATNSISTWGLETSVAGSGSGSRAVALALWTLASICGGLTFWSWGVGLAELVVRTSVLVVATAGTKPGGGSAGLWTILSDGDAPSRDVADGMLSLADRGSCLG